MNAPRQTAPRLTVLAAVPCIALLAAAPAQAKCSHTTTILNESGITLEFVELKSSLDGLGVYKSQWKGTRAIAPGATKSINWTSDFNCTSAGATRIWDVKLYRANGTDVHACGDMQPGTQTVRVKVPDLCFYP